MTDLKANNVSCNAHFTRRSSQPFEKNRPHISIGRAQELRTRLPFSPIITCSQLFAGNMSESVQFLSNASLLIRSDWLQLIIREYSTHSSDDRWRRRGSERVRVSAPCPDYRLSFFDQHLIDDFMQKRLSSLLISFTPSFSKYYFSPELWKFWSKTDGR